MNWSGRRWLLAIAVMGPCLVSADCRDDGECAVGARCLFARGYESRCGGYISMTKIDKDATRLDGPLRRRGADGYPCQFNVDCQPGLACYKANQGGFEGQCRATLPGVDDAKGKRLIKADDLPGGGPDRRR
jgi:hypothetical protein